MSQSQGRGVRKGPVCCVCLRNPGTRKYRWCSDKRHGGKGPDAHWPTCDLPICNDCDFGKPCAAYAGKRVA